MARTELPHGVILPAEYSDDWYEDMTSNLTKLDDVIGSDADKLSAEDVGAAALSNDYTDLDNKPDLSPYNQHLANTDIHVTSADKQKWNDNISQAYVLRYASTSLTPSSTISYSVLNNTDNIKAGDSVIDSAGQVFLIASVDSVNETVTVSAVLLTFALDANVMHLSGNETATGQKTFSGLATFNSYQYFTNSSVTKGTIPQATVAPYRIYFGSGVNYDASLFNIDTSVSNTGVQSFIFRSAENVVSGDDARFALIYDPNRAQPRYLSVKGNIEPNANNTYDCGSGTNIWKDLYVYHGYFCGWKKGDEPSTNARTVLTLLANRDTLGKSCAYITRFRQNRAQGAMQHLDFQSIAFDVVENEVRTNNVFSIQCTDWLNDVPQKVNIICRAQSYSYGNSSNKALFNDLNPGALSFPDLSAGLDISSYFDLSLYTGQVYTPTVNGWISLSITSPNRGSILYEYGNVSQTAYGVTDPNDTSKYRVSILIPCIASQTVTVYIRASGGTFNFAKFYPNLGNV